MLTEPSLDNPEPETQIQSPSYLALGMGRDPAQTPIQPYLIK